MPFQSKSQQRWMFSNHPAMVERWAKETPAIKSLPEKKKAPKRDKYGIRKD